MPTKRDLRYRTIVADPPWAQYLGRSGVSFKAESGGAFENRFVPYPTMTVEQITALPIGSLTDDAAHLYLWTTQQFLRQSYGVAEAWGFKPSYVLCWCKPSRGWGPGGTFQSNVEFILFARKGTLPALATIKTRWFDWSRGRHSAKPEQFFSMVEEVSPPPRLELFARRKRLGWGFLGKRG
jgi:N6-adenosine-specific RNA methylase IME4